MMQRNYYFILLISIILIFVLTGATYPGVYFQMNDPMGDEHGYGTYQYPTNIAFQPYQGLFDITEFKVWSEKKGAVYFDTSFAKITNPWAAPEGFIHQNLRIFINMQPDQGSTQLPEPGACVTFNPKYPWSIGLKIVGWGNSKLILFQNGKLTYHPLQVELLSDHQTIRATIPESIAGMPTKHWHYYVFTGSYDGFGRDFFRKIGKKQGEWQFGGGFDRDGAPQILDVLAEPTGAHTQEKQLRSFDLKTGKLAELYPVGADLKNQNYFLINICLLFIFLCSLIVLILKIRKIIWFRVKKDL